MNLIRKSILLLTLIIAAGGLFLHGCSQESKSSSLPDSAVIGVVETRGTEFKSRITYFDSMLNKVYEQSLPYASIGQVFEDPVSKDNATFLIPQGLYTKKDGNIALKIDFKTLAMREYVIEQPAMNTIAVNDNYIFTCNTLNFATTISRCSLRDNTVVDTDINDTYASFIYWYNGWLLVFCESLQNEKTSVLLYDEELNLHKLIDSSAIGGGVYKAKGYGNTVYFTGCKSSTDPNKGFLASLDLETSLLKGLELTKDWPWGIAIANDKLYVTHCDILEPDNESFISVIDLKTSELLDFREISHRALHMSIADGQLYVLGDWELFCYSLNDLQLIASTPISKLSDEEFTLFQPQHSYLTGLVVTA